MKDDFTDIQKGAVVIVETEGSHHKGLEATVLSRKGNRLTLHFDGLSDVDPETRRDLDGREEYAFFWLGADKLILKQ